MKKSIAYDKYMDYASVLGKTQNGRQEVDLFSCQIFPSINFSKGFLDVILANKGTNGT